MKIKKVNTREDMTIARVALDGNGIVVKGIFGGIWLATLAADTVKLCDPYGTLPDRQMGLNTFIYAMAVESVYLFGWTVDETKNWE